MFEILSTSLFSGGNKSLLKVFRGVCFMAMWSIWNWRNRYVHERNEKRHIILHEDIFAKIQSLSLLIAKSRDLDEVELERWKEARKEWVEKDECKNDMIKLKARSKMKKVINKVIGEEQNAFIQGRYILDGRLIANETCDYLKKEKKKAFLLNDNFEKSYDNVNWNFIQNTLLQMGFEEKWCKWIQTCQIFASVSVLVNGSPDFGIQDGDGVRKGVLFSPFLYLVVAKGLNVMFKDDVRNGTFKGVKIGRSDISISHLQDVDDTLIF
ncbi:cysteine-rich receptor-like protein kinase [Tanacetum coccineum]